MLDKSNFNYHKKRIALIPNYVFIFRIFIYKNNILSLIISEKHISIKLVKWGLK